MGLALIRDLRELREPSSAEEIEVFETDVLAGFVQPADADAYFGKVLRDAKPSTRVGRAAAVTMFFQFLEL